MDVPPEGRSREDVHVGGQARRRAVPQGAHRGADAATRRPRAGFDAILHCQRLPRALRGRSSSSLLILVFTGLLLAARRRGRRRAHSVRRRALHRGLDDLRHGPVHRRHGDATARRSARCSSSLGVNIGGMGVLTLASILGLVISKRLGLRAKLIAASDTNPLRAHGGPVNEGQTVRSARSASCCARSRCRRS